MKTQIFEYRGHVAAVMPEAGNYINNPKESGQLGTVISTKEIEITPKAKEMISNSKRVGGSFARIMLTKHSDGSGSSIGIAGFDKAYLGQQENLEIGRDCDISILDDCDVKEFEVPEDFKEFIDMLEVVPDPEEQTGE